LRSSLSSSFQKGSRRRAVHWFNVKNKHHRQLSAQFSLNPWLLAQGSLTQQLRAYAGGQFRVERVHESLQYPNLNEIKQLHIQPTQCVWVREVLLFGNASEPWVHARSVIPLKTLRGSGRRLKLLKNRSLGSLLFERGGVQIIPQTEQRKARELAQLPEGWTRRTTYVWHKKYVLVQETFLPAFVASLSREIEVQFN
jgi:chorismate--pyruvate lyase